MSELGSSTLCAVVDRPDHHCGDDVVIAPLCRTIQTEALNVLKEITCLLRLFRYSAPNCKQCQKEVIASRAVFAIVSGSDGLVGGRAETLLETVK